MTRPRRGDSAGTIHHVTLKGRNSDVVFCQSGDCTAFLRQLDKGCDRRGGILHAFCLMRNHVHLILSLQKDLTLGLIMKDVAASHCRRMNRILGRRGTLWSQRYWSEPLEDEERIATCHLYIESNPVRAGVVEQPESFEWSSYQAHAFGLETPFSAPSDLTKVRCVT